LAGWVILARHWLNMANYIVQADIESVFGADNIATWSNLDNISASANTDRITSAINYAESIIDDRFRNTRYAVPLQGDGVVLYVVKDWAAKLAGIWLYQSRGTHDDTEEGDKLSDVKESVYGEMDTYLSCQRELNAIYGYNDIPTAPTIV